MKKCSLCLFYNTVDETATERNYLLNIMLCNFPAWVWLTSWLEFWNLGIYFYLLPPDPQLPLRRSPCHYLLSLSSIFFLTIPRRTRLRIGFHGSLHLKWSWFWVVLVYYRNLQCMANVVHHIHWRQYHTMASFFTCGVHYSLTASTRKNHLIWNMCCFTRQKWLLHCLIGKRFGSEIK